MIDYPSMGHKVNLCNFFLHKLFYTPPITKISAEKGNIYGYEACIKTTNSEGLYYWLLQRADHIKVLAPEIVKQELIRKIKAMLMVYEKGRN